MKKKKAYKFSKEAHVASLGYKVSKAILGLPQWFTFVIATVLSVVYGLLITLCSQTIKSVTEGNADLINVLEVYIVVNIGMSILSFFSNSALRAFRLNEINRVFLKEYDRVFNSRTQDISDVDPAKIESTVNQIAYYKSEIRAQVVDIIEVCVPFTVTMYKVMEQNLIAGFAMLLLMAATMFLSLNGDNLFHFNENSSQMKGEMRSISVNNFIVIRMLKYMGSKMYAMKRQRDCQDIATPSFLNEPRQLYNAFMAIMYNTPVLIALGVAAIANNLGLAIFIAMNESTIQRMINNVGGITEVKSEIDGLYKVLEPLKGDDTPIEEKPSMPEYIILNDVKSTYPNSNLKFSIPELRIDKGKRYRFSGPSGSGKSTFFRYFAGEVEGNKRFNIRTFYIHQRSELLYDTVRNNITLGNQYVPDPVIIELINDAKLDKWFEALPNGLDTVIGRDTEPSGGEASRISLLRLFIHIRNYTRDGSKPNKDDIIILDEVTSALDKRDVFIKEDEFSTEEAVIKMIDRETKGCTMFVISHEDVTTSAFGFKNIIDEQLVIDIEGNDRILRKL